MKLNFGDDILSDDSVVGKNNDFFDDILSDGGKHDDEEDDGFQFEFESHFRIIDDKTFKLTFHKLLKRSYKGHDKEMDIIMKNNPFNIIDIENLEISDYKTNKINRGRFIVNYYNENKYDIFLKNFDL